MSSTFTKPQQRPKKPKPPNAIETALRSWFVSLPASSIDNQDVEDLISQAPKRWVVYEPMVLLPAGSFGASQWQDALRSVDETHLCELWADILTQISKTSKSSLTHLAANEGIPLHAEGAEENVLRSPSGLRILHGDFGPPMLYDSTAGVTEADFKSAFWVSTKQNSIHQTWAPRWTMFSRGNVKEKARVLEFHSPPHIPATLDLHHRTMDRVDLRDKWAIDLYAGIGYFVFSYAKLGMRLLCWELNPWSVEGLRRGAIGNGWGVRIIQGSELTSVSTEEVWKGDERIVIFLESNEVAGRRLAQLDKRGEGLEIRHVNCGFLPTSEPVWKDAWNMVCNSEKSWLHLHENVGVDDIERRRIEIQALFDGLAKSTISQRVVVEHVELVKTFAPGVWHCVFDVYISPSNYIT